MEFVKIIKQLNQIKEADMKMDKKDVRHARYLCIMMACIVLVAICDYEDHQDM